MNPNASPFVYNRIRYNKYGVILPYPNMPEYLIDSINTHPFGYTVLNYYPELIRWELIECNISNFEIYSHFPGNLTERAVTMNARLSYLWYLKNNTDVITWEMIKRKPSLKQLLPKDVSVVNWSM